MNTTHTPEALERLARKRAGARMGWLIHAAVYLAVNAGLAALSMASGRHWAVFPALGWGLGLLVHGLVVWFAGAGSSLRESMVQAELRRLQASRDAW